MLFIRIAAGDIVLFKGDEYLWTANLLPSARSCYMYD
jgi:hypothetical protein